MPTLGEYLDTHELIGDLTQGYLKFQRHPTLPLAILNYSNSATFDNYWTDVVQKCRGLVINTVEWDKGNIPKSEIISRPFRKFWNLNQQDRPDCQEGNLPAVIPTVTEKMDGWFGILWKCISVDNENGDTHYGIASRGSFTSPGAVFATEKLRKLVKYGAIEEFPQGYSAIFELIFREGKIVVDYPYEGLVLLALINNSTGEEMPYDDLFKIWAKILTYSADGRPWIRLVKAHRLGENPIETIKRMEEGLESKWTKLDKGPEKVTTKNQEGFVLTYPRPNTYPIKVKIKFEDYKRLHKLITGVTSQQLWRTLHDPMEPWLGAEVPDHFRTWASKWRDKLYAEFHEQLRQVITLASYGKQLNIADRNGIFKALNEENPEYTPIAMSLLDDKIYTVHQAIWKRIRPIGRETETFYREGDRE